MPRLLSRQKFIPNGFVFALPPLHYQAPRMTSFDLIVSEVERLLKANPALAAQYQWPTTHEAIADWVDETNAQHCLRMGWTDYIQEDGGPSVPKPSGPRQNQLLQGLRSAAAAAKALVAGAKTLMEWDESGEPPVPADQSSARARVCAACPLNQPGDFTEWFTVPAAELIKRRIAKAQERELKTPADDQLNLCTACHCPLKLKVHVPLSWIQKVLSPDQIARLRGGNHCWILAELAAEANVQRRD